MKREGINIMIENVEQLKKERPDLVEDFEKMSKEELLNQCYLECIDAINMEERVSVFMEECTLNMSKTNYTEESLRRMISDKQEFDINEFCAYEVESAPTDQDLVDSIKERAQQFDK